MRYRLLIPCGVALILLTVATLAAQAPAQTRQAAASAPAKKFTPSKPPWGDPDLQGIYTSDDYIGLGLQRQPQYGNRLYFTDEEVKQREGQIATQAAADLVE